jgi:predicted permease
MSAFSFLRSVASSIFHRSRFDNEMDAELHAHLEDRASDLERSGIPRSEALRRARLDFGGYQKFKEECREATGVTLVESLAQDLRFGLRMLRKSPGFTAVAVLTLSLGIGANTAIFSIVNSALLRPLSYPEPQQLYVVREIVPQWAKSTPSLDANLPDFQIWQKQVHSFEGVAITEGTSADLTGVGEPEQIRGMRVSASLLDVLGVRPALGPGFLPQQDEAGHGYVVILADRFWRSHFHADPSIIGKGITLDGFPHTVVGVLPPGALREFGTTADFFEPLNGPKDYETGLIGEFDFLAIARLKPTVTPQQALAELNLVQGQIAKQDNEGLDLRAELLPLQAQIVGPARNGLLMLLGAVGAVLLIVCVNLANLLLSRVPGRLRESAIRTALGATRWRLLTQLLTESALLALAGGALGVWLATFAVDALLHARPGVLPPVADGRLDARVLAFAVFLSILTVAIFGVLPAWRVAHVEPQETLKSGGTATTESRRTRRVRQMLVGFQVGLCTLLLILAGLLTSSLFHVLQVNPGFSIDHVLAAFVDLPPQSYSKPEMRLHFYNQVVAGVRAIPGVQSAAWVSILPLTSAGSVTGIDIPGAHQNEALAPMANYRDASPDYFSTMKIPLIAGRIFTESDRGQNIVVVSQSVAERFWPGQNPIGKTCLTYWGPAPPQKVIGVVGDIHTVSLDQPPVMMVYVPDWFAGGQMGVPPGASFVVRTATDPLGVATAVRAVIHKIDPAAPIAQLFPMTHLVSESVAVRGFQMSFALLFALSALFLAALGIFGVIAYSVEQRRHEFGIRMALGAELPRLSRMVIRQGMAPVLTGLLAGITAAILVGRLISSLLFGVAPYDPLTLVAVAAIVTLVALAACYIPARRATRVDPVEALRCE